MNIRAMCLQKLAERKKSIYWVARRVSDRKVCGQRVVYSWLTGKSDTSTRVAEAVMEELGILIVDVAAQWATVKLDNEIRVVVVGSSEWAMGEWRVIHSSREEAERARNMRMGLPSVAMGR